MICAKCQFENREAAKFCKECGMNLEDACLKCGTVYQLGSKFCDECGYKLDQGIEADRHAHSGEGERKYVTVLFSDLSGYTAMSEKLDPEEVKEITGRIFDEVSQVIQRYEGFIEKYAGDAAMALFGADRSHEDDPVRAVKAAKEIHELVETLTPLYQDRIGQPLAMHTGINTGLVVTGELNLEKGVHGVAGDAINVAARLSSAAKAGDILVDHETFTRSEGYFQFEDLEPIHLKGKTKAVQVHKVLSKREQPRKIHRLHGLRAILVGRKAEMARLTEAVDNLRQGKAAVFSIIGTAGTGKSRLVEELKASLELKEIQWLEGNAFAYAQNIPYFPLIDLISKAIQIDEGDLQEASVIGRSFYYDILKRISEIKDNIDKGLSGLERFDLIKTKSIQPYLEYIFKHALTQEAVYNGLLKSRAALGFVSFYLRKSEDTYSAGKDILEYGRRHSNIRSQVMGYWIMAFSYVLAGNRAAAIESLERALQISADPFYSQFVKLFLGSVYTAEGKISNAEVLLNDVSSYCRTFGCELFEEMINPDLETIEKSKMGMSEK